MTECVDHDGDGRGEGCDAGGDCDDTRTEIWEGCGTCVRPEEGCACTAPIDCYLPPTTIDGVLTCNVGTRYCVAGLYTGCNGIRSYTLGGSSEGRASAALVDGPSLCNPCDPACYVMRDYPTAPDLRPDNSSGVSYTSSPGGVTLTEMPVASADWQIDRDGDTVPDVADDAPTDATRTGVEGGFYNVLVYGGASVVDRVTTDAAIRDVDVYLLVDATTSMEGEIAALRAGFASGTYGDTVACPASSGTGIAGAVRCGASNAWFGLGYVREYPISPYGSTGDTVFSHLRDLGSDGASISAALGTITTSSNLDWPEAQTQALYSLASGAGLGGYVGPRSGCGGGRRGYPCFRSGAMPIVVLVTDSPFHNGPTTTYDYDDTAFAPSSSLPTPTAVSGNEAQASAYDVGDAATSWRSFTGTTRMMVDNYSSWGCSTRNAGDAVFRFTVSETSLIDLWLDGSTFDPVVGLRDASFTPIACNDDGSGRDSRLSRVLAPGTYYVIVDGNNNHSGEYQLTLGNRCHMSGAYCPVKWATAQSALVSQGIQVATVVSCRGGGATSDAMCPSTVSDAGALANVTSAVDNGGAPIVLDVASDGSVEAASVATAVSRVLGRRRNISVIARDNPATTGFDETRLVSAISAASCSGAAGACTGSCSGGSTVSGCLPGTTLRYDVTLRNGVIAPALTAQVFDFTLAVLADGLYEITTIPVRVVVPPVAARYPAQGTYTRTYDSTVRCLSTNEAPDWGQLMWTAVTPAGTQVRFDARAAWDVASLSTATPVTVTAASTSAPVDLGALFRDSNGRPYVRVTATLLASSDRQLAPTLVGFELTYRCVPGS